MKTRSGIVNPTFWEWALGTACAAILFVSLPERARIPFLVICLFGGIVYLRESGAGGLDGLFRSISTGGRE